MAAYRRFVAYVYEYRKDKKGVNCGFVRIEARGNICRIELHLLCPGLVSGSKCNIYGFVRKDEGIDGILLGICETEKEQINCILETSAEHMGGSDHSLDEMGGMVIATDQGGFFGTEWDDMPIRPEKFRVAPKVKENMTENTAENTAPDGNTETDRMQENDEREENKENLKEEQATEISGAGMRKEKTLSADSDTPASQELHTQSVSEQDIQLTQNVEIVSPDQEALNEQEAQSTQNTEAVSQEQRAQEQKPQNSRMCGTPCDVFRDGELHDCRKISPQDLCRMGRRTCLLRNNRFVQYGYYHFGHLLLCQNHCGQPVLGVPGRYDQQERFMANMFGFPYFKESSEIQVPGGKGGYWYRLIDSTNPNNRNGC